MFTKLLFLPIKRPAEMEYGSAVKQRTRQMVSIGHVLLQKSQWKSASKKLYLTLLILYIFIMIPMQWQILVLFANVYHNKEPNT